METIFSIKAQQWTQRSINSHEGKEYFNSWAESLPAKLFYLADCIANICATPFYLLKILFSSLTAFYTWGNETTNLKAALADFNDCTKDAMTSFFRFVFINATPPNSQLVKFILFPMCFPIYILERALRD